MRNVKKYSKQLLLGSVIFWMIGCNSMESKSPSEALSMLLQYATIKESDLYIRNLTGNEKGISLMSEGKGEDGNVYYKLGFSSDEKFETYYHVRWNTQKEYFEVEELADATWKKLE